MQETSFDIGMHDGVHMCHWCTTYNMKSECALECRDTPTLHYNPYFYTYDPKSVPTHPIHKLVLSKTLN